MGPKVSVVFKRVDEKTLAEAAEAVSSVIDSSADILYPAFDVPIVEMNLSRNTFRETEEI